MPAKIPATVVTGFLGAGKTTLTRHLRKEVPNLRFSISHTTRKPRSGEEDGREYHFVSRAEFEGLIQAGEFLEWAEVHGNLYGTSRRELSAAESSRGIIFDIDHQGARQISCALPEAVSVFILPPSMETLLQRLKGRASEDAETVARRFRVASEEIAHYGLFDYVLVNDVLAESTLQLASIFRAEECKRLRSAPLAEKLLRQGQIPE